MIEAYAVGVVAKLEDNVTPTLDRIIAGLEKASALTTSWIGELRGISASMGSFARNMEKAAAASGKLGDSPGLTAAAARFDQMAIATGDIAKNIEAARAAGGNLGGPINRLPGNGGGNAGGGSSNNGSNRSKTGSQALGATGLAIAAGIYENAELQDTLFKSIATEQIPIEKWGPEMAELRKRTMDYAQKYAWAAHGKIEPFAETTLAGARLLRTLPGNKQKEMLDVAMESAALEAKLKDVPMPEAMEAFIGLAHQAGAYTPEKAGPLFESMVQASLTTHATLGQIAQASSYVTPMLTAAGGNAPDAIMMIATMQQAGIMNSKSGTWLNALFENALPNSLGSGLFKNDKQNEALHLLKLYSGNKANFYTNGVIDPRKEISILAEARKHMTAERFGAATRLAFGQQGARAADFFSEKTVLDNLDKLMALKDQHLDPNMVAKALLELNTASKADQAIANANITIMNASTAFTAPVNWILDKTSGAAAKAAPFAEEHPGVTATGIAGGLFAGMVGTKMIWKAVGAAADKSMTLLATAFRASMGMLIEGAAAAIGSISISGAAMAAVSALIGVSIGKLIQDAADSHIQKSSDYTVSSTRDWLAHSWLGKKTGWFDFGKNEALHFVQAPSVHKQDPVQTLPVAPPVPPKANGPVPPVNQDSLKKLHDYANAIGNNQASTQIINFNVDGRKLASYMIPSNMTGTSGFNTSADRPTPGMGSLGLS